MEPGARIIRFEAPVLAEALYLIGQAWVKRLSGDLAGALEDEAATERLLPRDTIATIRLMIIEGDLPMPGTAPEAMDAWLEQCRLAGAGEWKLTQIAPAHPGGGRQAPVRPGVESEAEFQDRLHQIRLDAEAAMKADWENRGQ